VADFDPTTIRGKALVAAERAVGFDSRFDDPPTLTTKMERVGLDTTTVAGGFGYVVAGVA
jgi:demethylmenaquinone methyltransferase/2-methoxy-6-polyprenyl-1,4-benzoquinol methylase